MAIKPKAGINLSLNHSCKPSLACFLTFKPDADYTDFYMREYGVIVRIYMRLKSNCSTIHFITKLRHVALPVLTHSLLSLRTPYGIPMELLTSEFVYWLAIIIIMYFSSQCAYSVSFGLAWKRSCCLGATF